MGEAGSSPALDASGQPIDFEELVNEIEATSELAENFDHYMALGYTALDEADMERYHKVMEEYINILDNSNENQRARDIRLTHKIVVFVQLGKFDKARDLMSDAIDAIPNGLATSHLVSKLRNVRLDGLIVSNEDKLQFQAAERAIQLCYYAHDWARGCIVLSAAEQAFPGLLSSKQPGLDRTEWQLGTYIGTIWEYNEKSHEAFSWYMWSLRSLERQRTHVVDPEARRGMGRSIHYANLFAGLVRLSLKFAKEAQDAASAPEPPRRWGLVAHSWLDQALVFMEGASARTLLELIMTGDSATVESLESWSTMSYLRRQVDDLRSVYRTQEKHLQNANIAVQNIQDPKNAAYSSEVKKVRALERRAVIERNELNRLDEEIKQCQGELEKRSEADGEGTHQQLSDATKSLLKATQYAIDTTSTFAAIPLNTAMIQLNSSRGGLIVFGITNRGIEVTSQDSINNIELRKLVLPFVHALRNNQLKQDDDAYLESLSRVSDIILKPLHSLLERVEHVIFVPASIFMSFPFSCLPYKGLPLIFHKAVSQVPSLAVLEQLVKARGQKQTSVSATPAKPKVFALVHPHVKQSSKTRPSVMFGALKLYHLFGNSPKTPQELKEDEFAIEYRNATMVHVGTHGYQSALSPWQSYLSLAERFRVMDLAKLKTRASLVVFCACLSGLGKVTNGNDVLGFSHAVLQSGAQVYMGALWKVGELETLLLLNLFYRKLAETDEQGVATSIAKAWQYAQVTLYGMDKAKAIQLLQEALEDWEHAERSGVNPASFVPNGRPWLEHQIKHVQWTDNHFKNPYYWASFSLIGNAAVTLN